MIVEFFKRGTGGSSGPIDYFLGKDRDREYAKLLSGDLEEVAELIDSSPYVKKYTAGCLSFFEDDLSDTKKKNLMAAFEKTLFPGLAPEQYRIVWIEHRDKEYIEKNEETGEEKKQRRLELNFLIPNIEITTGKRLQPFFAKADLNRVDDFKNIVNYKYQLFDPDDPINRRSVKVAKYLPKDKKDFISAMHIEVALAIIEGIVSDRESLKSWMNEIGLEITRITKNQISVKNPNNPEGKPIPLKGEFYEQNFRYSEQSTKLKREASEQYRREADSRYTECIERYKKLCESKSEYHLERYAPRDRTDSAELTRQSTEQENKHTSEYKYNRGELEQGYASDARQPTDANTEHEKGLADIKRIEPSDSRTSEAEKSPYFINFSPDFSATYFAYQQYVFRLYQQNKLQRTKSDQDITADRASEASRSKASLNFEQSRATEKVPENQLQGLNNEFRSPIIENHRRTTASIEATTAEASRSLGTYTSTVSNNRAVKELHENFKREAQRSSTDRTGISENNAEIIRSNYLSNFFTDCTRELERAATSTFKRFSERLANREPGPQPNQTKITEFSAVRDRETNNATSEADERKVRLSEQLSRKISGFSTDLIFKALDELSMRKQKKQDYESPSIDF